MKIICPNDKSLCFPLQIVKQTDLTSKGKMGGRPPEGIFPKKFSVPLKYFTTINFSDEENLFISLFVADFENLLKVRGKINPLGFLDVVIHTPRKRVVASEFQSHISEHDIQILNIKTDIENFEEELFLSGHKIGGHPYLIRNKPKLVEGINQLFNNRFLHILQMDFPGNADDVISGDWFFGDGMFSLFGRFPFETKDWYWYWDM